VSVWIPKEARRLGDDTLWDFPKPKRNGQGTSMGYCPPALGHHTLLRSVAISNGGGLYTLATRHGAEDQRTGACNDEVCKRGWYCVRDIQSDYRPALFMWGSDEAQGSKLFLPNGLSTSTPRSGGVDHVQAPFQDQSAQNSRNDVSFARVQYLAHPGKALVGAGALVVVVDMVHVARACRFLHTYRILPLTETSITFPSSTIKEKAVLGAMF